MVAQLDRRRDTYDLLNPLAASRPQTQLTPHQQREAICRRHELGEPVREIAVAACPWAGAQ
jgi:hypothetical protein